MTIDERIEYAEQRRVESFGYDSLQGISYWDGYIKALKDLKKENREMNKDKNTMDLTDKRILDATCGSRSIWFQKQHPMALYMDCREEHDARSWKSTNGNSIRTLDVEPDVIADFTDMPFPSDTFNLVVFGPPHLVKINETAWLKKRYGRLPEDWQQLIHDGFWECMRVLKPFGTLVFKWAETEIPTRDVINAIGVEPLFGHRSGKKMNTHWLCFMKEYTK